MARDLAPLRLQIQQQAAAVTRGGGGGAGAVAVDPRQEVLDRAEWRRDVWVAVAVGALVGAAGGLSPEAVLAQVQTFYEGSEFFNRVVAAVLPPAVPDASGVADPVRVYLADVGLRVSLALAAAVLAVVLGVRGVLWVGALALTLPLVQMTGELLVMAGVLLYGTELLNELHLTRARTRRGFMRLGMVLAGFGLAAAFGRCIADTTVSRAVKGDASLFALTQGGVEDVFVVLIGLALIGSLIGARWLLRLGWRRWVGSRSRAVAYTRAPTPPGDLPIPQKRD